MSTAKLSNTLEAVLNEHLQNVKNLIVTRAAELTQEGMQNLEIKNANLPITVKHLNRAIEEYAPGEIIEIAPKSFWSRFWEAITPFTLVCLIMTIVFAAFGAIYGESKEGAKSFIDIAKIFAGVIVGSTSAAFIGKNTFKIKQSVSRSNRRLPRSLQ